MKNALLVMLAVPVLLLAGCAKSRESQLTGSWTADIGGQTLTLKEDHSFNLALPGGAAMDGTWKLTTDQVHLDPVTLAGKSVADVMKQMDQLEKSNPQYKDMVEQQKTQIQNLNLAVDADNKKMTISTTSGKTTTKVTFSKNEAAK